MCLENWQFIKIYCFTKKGQRISFLRILKKKSRNFCEWPLTHSCVPKTPFFPLLSRPARDQSQSVAPFPKKSHPHLYCCNCICICICISTCARDQSQSVAPFQKSLIIIIIVAVIIINIITFINWSFTISLRPFPSHQIKYSKVQVICRGMPWGSKLRSGPAPNPVELQIFKAGIKGCFERKQCSAGILKASTMMWVLNLKVVSIEYWKQMQTTWWRSECLENTF